mmetsp:Transcript_5991/g.17008  ORF Transcript_5991/g.17008 Transcript_5991/m.17008 type:complete len:244 (+) Transcript_5991:182-913(+)
MRHACSTCSTPPGKRSTVRCATSTCERGRALRSSTRSPRVSPLRSFAPSATRSSASRTETRCRWSSSETRLTSRAAGRSRRRRRGSSPSPSGARGWRRRPSRASASRTASSPWCERSARTRRRAPNPRSAGGRERGSAPSCNVRHAAGGSSRAAHTSLALALSVSTLGEGDPWRRRTGDGRDGGCSREECSLCGGCQWGPPRVYMCVVRVRYVGGMRHTSPFCASSSTRPAPAPPSRCGSVKL